MHFPEVKRTVRDMKPVYYTRAQLIPVVMKTAELTDRAARNRLDSQAVESDAVDAAGNPLWSAGLVAKLVSERSGIMRDKS